MPTPFYERDLDSFDDEIITAVRCGENGLWYATLDVGSKSYVSDPDFSTCSQTREEAISACARRIRSNAKGIGSVPHGLLVPGYDLHFRLMKHWNSKECGEE